MKYYTMLMLLIILSAYFYGYADRVRKWIINVVDYGFIKPHMGITRSASHILAFVLYLIPIVTTFSLCYEKQWYYWKTYAIIVAMFTAFSIVIISVTMFITKVLGVKTTLLNWLGLGFIITLYLIWYTSPVQ